MKKSIMCISGSKLVSFSTQPNFFLVKKSDIFPTSCTNKYSSFSICYPNVSEWADFFPLVWLSVSFDARGDPYRDDLIGYRKIIGVMIRRAWRLAAVSWMNESTVRSSSSFDTPNGSSPRSSGREDSNLLVNDVHLLFDIRIRSIEESRRPN